MKELHKLKDKLMDELKMYSGHSDLTGTELGMVHKLTSTIKNIDKICMYEDGEYSERRYSRGDMRHSYDDDSSYRSRHGVTGPYSRDGYSGDHSERRYSRGTLVDEMRMLMDKAGSDTERRAIHDAITMMER